MTIILSNSNLPNTVSSPFNLSSPVATIRSGESLAPLFVVNTFGKYPGVDPVSTEITNPDASYVLYKLNIPFLSVLGVRIENYTQVVDIDRLTNQRFFFDNSDLYFIANTPPNNYQIAVEINAPIPISPCELITSIPDGLEATQILYRGLPLIFGQIDQQITIDCSDSCCRIRGGEVLTLTGIYTSTPVNVGVFHVFNVNQNLGVVDYVEWRGLRFSQEGLNPGCFLWDSIAKLLKLII